MLSPREDPIHTGAGGVEETRGGGWKLCDGRRQEERERESLEDKLVVNERLKRVRANI